MYVCVCADHCLRLDCPEATVEQLSRVHTPDLVEFVKAVSLGLPPPPAYEGRLLTSDTYTNQSTFTAARLAAGGAAAVAEAVARGDAAGGAAIVRPPGHHAESNMAMGFCFFNNAAVAARAAQAAGAQRVLILDWDVHHGNGTQVRTGQARAPPQAHALCSQTHPYRIEAEHQRAARYSSRAAGK